MISLRDIGSKEGKSGNAFSPAIDDNDKTNSCFVRQDGIKAAFIVGAPKP